MTSDYDETGNLSVFGTCPVTAQSLSMSVKRVCEQKASVCWSNRFLQLKFSREFRRFACWSENQCFGDWLCLHLQDRCYIDRASSLFTNDAADRPREFWCIYSPRKFWNLVKQVLNRNLQHVDQAGFCTECLCISIKQVPLQKISACQSINFLHPLHVDQQSFCTKASTWRPSSLLYRELLRVYQTVFCASAVTVTLFIIPRFPGIV
jgi:hypothetical protein